MKPLFMVKAVWIMMTWVTNEYYYNKPLIYNFDFDSHEYGPNCIHRGRNKDYDIKVLL